MTGNDLRSKYLKFFQNKGHRIISSAPLVPENDPTTLFTSSGMQPLVPYLLGEKHPDGQRLVNSQKSFRSGDIDEVGDNRHTTFFEMLGNWSLGDYFKKEQLTWLFEFLTEEVGLEADKLFVTVFSGDPDNDIPPDQESVEIWQQLFKDKGMEAKFVSFGEEANGSKLGMQGGRIFAYDVSKNWWSRSGTPSVMPAGEPGGPDSEVFYDFGIPHDKKFGDHCHPNCDCGRFIEIGNSVFMQYRKQDDGSLVELKQKNVDFGGGLERILAAKENQPDVFRTDLFWPMIEKLEVATGKRYEQDSLEPMRIIADHIKASVFLIHDGVLPGNKQQGYVLRRLLRRASLKMSQLRPGESSQLLSVVDAVLAIYQDVYLTVEEKQQIKTEIGAELTRFDRTLARGLKLLNQHETITGKIAFDMLSTYGFPWELTAELARERGDKLNEEEFKSEFEKHQQLSRTASKGMFKGGLADQSETVTKYHTATHLIHQALRLVLGEHVQQTGSNITASRLRFDFTPPQARSEAEIKKVESIVNREVKADLSVSVEEMDIDEAKQAGALAFFGERYSARVKVYSIGNFSKEVCGGPHVTSTAVIGPIEIYKQESVGAGRRRIYARLQN